MSRSRSRLAADWFAKLRVNAQTQKLEHEDIVTVESEVTTATDSVSVTVNSQIDAVSADVATKLDASGGTISGDLTVSGTTNATVVDLGVWTITESAGTLYFAANGVNKFAFDSSGNFIAISNVTGYGTV